MSAQRSLYGSCPRLMDKRRSLFWLENEKPYAMDAKNSRRTRKNSQKKLSLNFLRPLRNLCVLEPGYGVSGGSATCSAQRRNRPRPQRQRAAHQPEQPGNAGHRADGAKQHGRQKAGEVDRHHAQRHRLALALRRRHLVQQAQHHGLHRASATPSTTEHTPIVSAPGISA